MSPPGPGMRMTPGLSAAHQVVDANRDAVADDRALADPHSPRPDHLHLGRTAVVGDDVVARLVGAGDPHREAVAVVVFPPAPTEGSRLPLELRRASAKSPLPDLFDVLPASRTLPSGWTATAVAPSSPMRPRPQSGYTPGIGATGLRRVMAAQVFASLCERRRPVRDGLPGRRDPEFRGTGTVTSTSAVPRPCLHLASVGAAVALRPGPVDRSASGPPQQPAGRH